MFQSPHGDSFFSDNGLKVAEMIASVAFQSPHGDSFFSDELPESMTVYNPGIVSIPSRGFVLF